MSLMFTQRGGAGSNATSRRITLQRKPFSRVSTAVDAPAGAPAAIAGPQLRQAP